MSQLGAELRTDSVVRMTHWLCHGEGVPRDAVIVRMTHCLCPDGCEDTLVLVFKYEDWIRSIRLIFTINGITICVTLSPSITITASVAYLINETLTMSQGSHYKRRIDPSVNYQ